MFLNVAGSDVLLCRVAQGLKEIYVNHNIVCGAPAGFDLVGRAAGSTADGVSPLIVLLQDLDLNVREGCDQSGHNGKPHEHPGGRNCWGEEWEKEEEGV